MSNNRWTAGPKGSSSAARVGGKPAYAGQRQIAGLGGLGNRFLGSDGGRVGQELLDLDGVEADLLGLQHRHFEHPAFAGRQVCVGR